MFSTDVATDEPVDALLFPVDAMVACAAVRTALFAAEFVELLLLIEDTEEAGILDPDQARIDAQDSPGRVAELKDVSRHAFDGEILIDCTNEGFTRFHHDPVIRIIRDCASGSQR